MYCFAATVQTVDELSQISTRYFNQIEFLAVTFNITTNIDNSISSTDKNITVTETPVQYIDVQLGSTKADSHQIIPALESIDIVREIRVFPVWKAEKKLRFHKYVLKIFFLFQSWRLKTCIFISTLSRSHSIPLSSH
jgi:hypothetical protein